MQIQSIDRRIAAVLDVFIVFLATFTLIWLTALLPIGEIEHRFLNYAVMIAFPLLLLLIALRDLKTYGLFFQRLKNQLDITLAVSPVVVIDGAITGWLLPMWIPNAVIRWEGALILSIVSVGLFFWTAWILRSKPSPALALPALLCVISLSQVNAILPERLVSFLFYLVFLGPGEELLFRGYIQSRLNVAFGRSFCFWGVPFGWGLLISALMFGFMHCIGRFNPFTARYEFTPWWGLWAIFGGLMMGYIREKAGSVLPTAILHGLPQAIASLMLGFFSVR